MTGSEVVEFASSLDNLFNPGIAELDHIAGIHFNQVVVLHAPVGLFELCNVLSELMLYHQAAIEEQLYGIVESGPADPVVFVLHEDVERLDIEMAVPGIDLIQDGITFGCFAVPLLLQIVSEDLLYSLFGLLLHHN